MEFWKKTLSPAGLMKHPCNIPIILTVVVQYSMGLLSIIHAVNNPDTSWNKKGDQEPWEAYRDRRYKDHQNGDVAEINKPRSPFYISKWNTVKNVSYFSHLGPERARAPLNLEATKNKSLHTYKSIFYQQNDNLCSSNICFNEIRKDVKHYQQKDYECYTIVDNVNNVSYKDESNKTVSKDKKKEMPIIYENKQNPQNPYNNHLSLREQFLAKRKNQPKKLTLLELLTNENCATKTTLLREKYLTKSHNKLIQAMPTKQKFIHKNVASDKNKKVFRSKSFAVLKRKKIKHKSMRSYTLPCIKIKSPRFKNSRQNDAARNSVNNDSSSGLEDYYISDLRPTSFVSLKKVNESLNRSKKSRNSYLSPTIASTKKSISSQIERIEQMMSPTRKRIQQQFLVPQAVKYCKSQIVPFKEILKDEFQYSRVTYRERQGSFVKGVTTSTVKRTPPKMHQVEYTKQDSGLYGHHPSEDEKFSEYTTNTDELVASSNGYYKTLVQEALVNLQSGQWSEALQGLADVVELSRQAGYEQLYAHMTTVTQRLLDLLKSPRSHVCRVACQAAGQLFETMKDTRRPEFDNIVDTLLSKTADSNKFIREDANVALDMMVTYIPIFHSVKSLCARGPVHKNSLVRIATARLLVCLVGLVGAEAILNPGCNEHTRKKILYFMGQFFIDQNNNVRKFAILLYKVLSKHQYFEAYYKMSVDKNVYVRTNKVLLNMSNYK